MNPDTGEIRNFQSSEAAKRAGFTVPLTPDEAATLLAKTPAQRVQAMQPLNPRHGGYKVMMTPAQAAAFNAMPRKQRRAMAREYAKQAEREERAKKQAALLAEAEQTIAQAESVREELKALQDNPMTPVLPAPIDYVDLKETVAEFEERRDREAGRELT